MSYYGTILMTRADVVMTGLPHIESIGFRHRRLRELGDGWQVVETSGWDDPPDLERAVGEAARWWKAPVFGAYVADICAQIHGAAAGLATWSGHLPDAGDVDCGMRHRPAVLAGDTLDDLEARIIDWAAAVGLLVSAARLSRALRYRHTRQGDSDGPYLSQHDQIFELLHAFGFPVMSAPRAYALDPDDEPFAEVTAGMWGLASQARSAAAYRAAGARSDQAADWEAEAIALDLDVYAALYGGGHPVAELTARAEWISSLYRAAREGTPPPPRELGVGGSLVRNPQHIAHDLGPSMIASQLAARRETGDAMSNETYLADPTNGPGRWPDLT
ncbi:hypothetical protein ACI2K4_01440 [Micromonospora sp. NPDC050397]|uniref:hypothetical protein n=1 Tax=Micromonospora sp. NPDC050397 TaxID=3364279 RepID=UPI00384A4FAD